MSDELARLIEPLDRGEPIREEALQTLMTYIAGKYGARLPEDYVAFLHLANGADGELVGGNSVVLWQSEQLPGLQEDLETEDRMPGFFIIGSDSGDYLYGIDLRDDAPAQRYLETEDAAMDWDYILWRGSSFVELLHHADRLAGAGTEPGSGPGFLGRLIDSLKRFMAERPRAG